MLSYLTAFEFYTAIAFLLRPSRIETAQSKNPFAYPTRPANANFTIIKFAKNHSMANLPKIVTTLGVLLLPLLNFAQRPFLDKSGEAAKMMVQNKPFIILGAEIHNSTGSDTAGLKKVLKQAKALNMNTILAYAYWEFIEPEEGKFNFWLLDQLLQAARKEKLKVALVWFGSWKSTTSSYAPAWVKTNPQRFPRHTLADGKTGDPFPFQRGQPQRRRQSLRRIDATPPGR